MLDQDLISYFADICMMLIYIKTKFCITEHHKILLTN